MTETIERNSILACFFTQAKLELAKDGNEQLCVLMELFRSKGSTDIYMKSLPSNSVKKLTLMGKNSLSFEFLEQIFILSLREGYLLTVLLKMLII